MTNREQLISNNMQWAVSRSRQFECTGCLEPQDLEQEAMVAMLEAAESFDPAKATFRTYAGTVIDNRLGKALAGESEHWNDRDDEWGVRNL